LTICSQEAGNIKTAYEIFITVLKIHQLFETKWTEFASEKKWTEYLLKNPRKFVNYKSSNHSSAACACSQIQRSRASF
jgi:hypothetical protein